MLAANERDAANPCQELDPPAGIRHVSTLDRCTTLRYVERMTRCADCSAPAETAGLCWEHYFDMISHQDAAVEAGACTACGRTDALAYCEDCDGPVREPSDLLMVAFAITTVGGDVVERLLG